MKLSFAQIVIILTLLIIPHWIYSQSTFQIAIGGSSIDVSSDIEQTDDNGYMILGYSSSFGAGGNDVSLLKINSGGTVEWAKYYGGWNDDEGHDIKKMSNGDFIISGKTNSSGVGNKDIFILRVNSDGDLIWSKTYGESSWEQPRGKAIEASNGDIIVIATTQSIGAGGKDALFLRISPTGDLLIDKTYGNSDNDWEHDYVLMNNGDIVLSGRFNHSNYGSYGTLMRIDETGNILWAKTYNTSGACKFIRLRKTENDNLIAAGRIDGYGAGGTDIFVAMTDGAGNLLWNKTYGGPGYEKAIGIAFSPDQNIVISGFTDSFGFGSYDIFLIKTDMSGNLIWGKVYGGSADDYIYGGYGLLNENNSGYIVNGETKSFGMGSTDMYIIKTNLDGVSGCNEQDFTPTVTTPIGMENDLTLSSSSGMIEGNPGTTVTDVTMPVIVLCPLNPPVAAFETPDTLICVDDCINFYDLSENNPTSWNWYFESGSPATSSNQNPQNICYHTPGQFDVKLIVSNMYGLDSVLLEDYITVMPEPEVNLGNDTLICEGTDFSITPGSEFDSYLWNTGSTDSIITIADSGLYWVQVTNEYGCIGTDSVNISFLPSPEINLGNDTLICIGTSLILNAGSGFESYLWNTGSTDSTIVIETEGTYWVEVTNEFGCSVVDSIVVGIYPDAGNINLGNDTTFCFGIPFVINAGYGYTFYEWQDGSNDSVFIADTAGIYYVHVINPCGEGWDTIQLSLFPITEISLGNDTSVCLSDGFVLLDPGMGFQSYLWQDGSQNQTYYTNQTGEYWVEVIDSYGCPVSDTVILEFIDPDPDLGADTTICNGEEITLSASEGFVSYLWSDGSDGLNITVSNEGAFWCEVTDTMGCVGADSVLLSLMFPPDISIGNDTSICTGDSLMLYVNPYDSINVYHWFDGSSDSVKTVSAEGYYWIQAANNCGSDFDSVFVSLLPLPYVFIGNDTVIGIKDEVTLDAGNGFAGYLWNTGSEYQSITVSDSGNYWVRVSDGTCFNSDTINIEIVSCDLFVPIVFTPNWDSYNDYFYAVVSDDITHFDLAVYNRWGERMWETTDINGKWDGKKNNTDCATGTYFWVVEYKCLLSNKTFTLRGSVTLLR